MSYIMVSTPYCVTRDYSLSFVNDSDDMTRL